MRGVCSIYEDSPRLYERPKLKVKLEPSVIEIEGKHRILGQIIDDTDSIERYT
jgi:hypothetical protein